MLRGMVGLRLTRIAPLALVFFVSACFESTDLPSESSTGSAGSGESSGDGDGDGDDVASCEEYCSFVGVCEGDFAMYSTVGPCLSVCEEMPLGTKMDQTGNNVGCRTFWAVQAGEGGPDQETFCQNAGPSGNGVCGGFCESFCAIALNTCPGIFADAIDCTTDCMDWDTTETYNANSPEADTYACRLKHLTYATIDPTTHCSHIADVSAVCKIGRAHV